jgi:hypothetical protein
MGKDEDDDNKCKGADKIITAMPVFTAYVKTNIMTMIMMTVEAMIIIMMKGDDDNDEGYDE